MTALTTAVVDQPDTCIATIWTIGHSTRALDVFLGLLAQAGIEAVADVRRFPNSRRQTQYGSEALQAALAEHEIAYLWLPDLGGRRPARPDSPNIAWRNASFRGYADYMESAAFASGMAELSQFRARQRTTLMCAEVLWWRCHRALIADVLRQRGVEVLHILDDKHTTVHPYTSAASIIDGQLSYRLSQVER